MLVNAHTTRYEESLQFVSNDTTSLFGDDGMSRDERGDRVQYGPDSSKWYVLPLVVTTLAITPHRHNLAEIVCAMYG